MRGLEAAELTWCRMQRRQKVARKISLPFSSDYSTHLCVPVDAECYEALMAIKPAGADASSAVFCLSSSQINR